MAKPSSRLKKVETSMYSHPLYSGTQPIIDTEGPVEKFYKYYRVLSASGGRHGAAST